MAVTGCSTDNCVDVVKACSRNTNVLAAGIIY